MSPDRGAAREFLALGDSYTIGEGVGVAQRWPNQLAQALRENGVDIGDPQTIAMTGWTTDELDAAIDSGNPGDNHALVTLLIGVNNQYRGRSVDEYAEQFSSLLQRAVGFAEDRNDHVIVVSIPDWGVTRFAQADPFDPVAIATAIDDFNAAAQAIANLANVSFVDITDLTRAHPEELVADGLHPDTAQYARWVERILPEALTRMSR
ncbi:MAG: GDSL-type esterase/lipase family protein [Dokdonella sp.]